MSLVLHIYINRSFSLFFSLFGVIENIFLFAFVLGSGIYIYTFKTVENKKKNIPSKAFFSSKEKDRMSRRIYHSKHGNMLGPNVVKKSNQLVKIDRSESMGSIREKQGFAFNIIHFI